VYLVSVRFRHQSIERIVNLAQTCLKHLFAFIEARTGNVKQAPADVLAFIVQLVPDESALAADGDFN